MKDENAFSQEQRPVVYLVGIGMGGEDQLTGRAMDCLEAAQVITGADRMLESVRPYTEGKRVKDGMWNTFPAYPACPISAPDWERAGRMSIRSAAMDGSVMWWPI